MAFEKMNENYLWREQDGWFLGGKISNSKGTELDPMKEYTY